jgi:DNA-binding response OmpR family regulator
VDREAPEILIVEDDPPLRAAMRRVLEQHGYRVAEATTAAELERSLRARRPALMVLDIQLPDADGRDVLAKLKKAPATADIPVLVWSGRFPDSDRLIALELGAEDFVEKGPPSQLLTKIERILLRTSGHWRRP